MLGVLRSELIRTRRPGVALGWIGLTLLFAALINSVLFSIVADGGGTPQDGPGVAFPSMAELESADGLLAGMASGASFFGIVTLAFWAIVAASDYTTGLIRLLASAPAGRWRLLAGKVGALVLCTAAATTVALVVSVIVAPLGASSAGIDTSAWQDAAASTLGRAWLDLFGALVVWGTIGLVLATMLRSSSIAIGGGVGYLLVVEPVIEAAAPGLADWLPGNTLTALAQGGTDAVPYGAALILGALYVLGGLGLALGAVMRRDITD